MIVIFSFFTDHPADAGGCISQHSDDTNPTESSMVDVTTHFNELDKLAVQAQLSMGPEENRVDLLYIGDSIVHRFETVGRATWDHYYHYTTRLQLGQNTTCPVETE